VNHVRVKRHEGRLGLVSLLENIHNICAPQSSHTKSQIKHMTLGLNGLHVFISRCQSVRLWNRCSVTLPRNLTVSTFFAIRMHKASMFVWSEIVC